MGFEEFHRRLARGILPTKLGQEFAAVPGTAQDIELALLKDGVKTRWPTTSPDDALYYNGRDRGFERYDADTNPGYRERISDPFGTHAFDGTAFGLQTELEAFGIVDIAVVEDHDGHYADGQWWSRIWVVLGPDMPWEPMTTPFVQGDQTQGSTATRREVAAVKRIFRRLKDAGGYAVSVILAFADAVQNHTSTMPFTQGEADVCIWHLGKLQGDPDTMTMPFVQGLYEE